MANGTVVFNREVIHNKDKAYSDVMIYRCRCQKKQRRALGNPTKESQEVVNERNRRMLFARYLHANFEEGRDLYVTLTFDEGSNPETRAETKRVMDRFIRRQKNRWDKRSPSAWELEHNGGERLPLKYIYVIEGGDGKRHHVHMVMTGGLTEQEIKALWGHAEIVNVRVLQSRKTGFEGLSVYMTKQGGMTKGEHHWYASRNLEKPGREERNNQIGRETVEDLADVIEEINGHVGEGVIPTAERYAPIEERYHGYYVAEAEAKYIEEFHEWVIHVKLYRKDTEAGRAEAKRRRAEEREIARRRAAFGEL